MGHTGSRSSESAVLTGLLTLMEMADLREAIPFSVEAPYRGWAAAQASTAASDSNATGMLSEFFPAGQILIHTPK